MVSRSITGPVADLSSTELFERLNELREGRTSIYITHRFGTFNKSADLVLFM